MSNFSFGQYNISTEKFIGKAGNEIEIEKYHFVFNEWKVKHSFDTYNGKPLLNFEGEPVFAELYFLRILEKLNFKGVWVDTYRNKFWQRLPHFSFPVIIDKKLEKVYTEIYELKGGKKSGCFDVIAYNEENFIFAELKRKKKDEIQQSQIDWLESAMKIKTDKMKFIIVEWETNINDD